MTTVLRQTMALLCLSFLPALGQAFYLRDKIPWQSPAVSAQQISLEDAASWPDALWFDARSRELFDKEHVPGALLLNEDEWNELLPEALAHWSPEKRIVVYCSSQSCGAANEVARRLREEAHLQKVFVLIGGWEAWKAKH